MHVPDGFIDIPTSIGGYAVATGAIAVSLRGARRELNERTAPLAGLVAVFVFAAQLMNFPVAGGTSGHLLGAVLAAVPVADPDAVGVLGRLWAGSFSIVVYGTFAAAGAALMGERIR